MSCCRCDALLPQVELLEDLKRLQADIYLVQWENQQCELRTSHAEEELRDMQLLHTTKELQVRAPSSAALACNPKLVSLLSSCNRGRGEAADLGIGTRSAWLGAAQGRRSAPCHPSVAPCAQAPACRAAASYAPSDRWRCTTPAC